MKPVIIIGAGGHGKVVADIVQKSGDKVLGVLDDNLALGKNFMDIPIFGIVDDYEKYVDKAEFVIVIGDAKIREEIAKRLNGVNWYTAVHPTAVISDIGVSIEEGTVIMANVIINPGSHIGRHCIINSGAIVEHDNVIDDFVHVSVGSKLSGTVHVGKATWIGVGTTVSNNINICEGCMIGAGTVVIKNIEMPGTYVGVPARRIDMKIKDKDMSQR